MKRRSLLNESHHICGMAGYVGTNQNWNFNAMMAIGFVVWSHVVPCWFTLHYRKGSANTLCGFWPSRFVLMFANYMPFFRLSEAIASV